MARKVLLGDCLPLGEATTYWCGGGQDRVARDTKKKVYYIYIYDVS